MSNRVVLIRHGDDTIDDWVQLFLRAQHDTAQHHWLKGFLDRLFGAL